jgi:transmembrane sensor
VRLPYITIPHKYTKMTSEELEAILERYINNTCTPEERRFVERSFNAMGGDTADLKPALKATMQKRIWEKLSKEAGNEAKHQTGAKYWRVGGVAATLLLLAVSLFLINRNRKIDRPYQSSIAVTVFNNGNDVKKIKLSDGSTIKLHPGSEVSYPEKFSHNREVHLVGEAFFEVEKDPLHPFLVYANEVTTKVLGTSFRIKAHKNEKEVMVAVRTGKVSVYTNSSGLHADQPTLPSAEAVILTPNQQIIYNRKKEEAILKLVDDPQKIQPQTIPAVNYTNTPVIQIIKSMEESYGIDIQYDENILSSCTITSASEMMNEGLYEQLEIICNAIGARYKFSGVSITIEAQRCKK